MPSSYIEIEFRDSGEGITEDILTHIFEPFFTTKEEGKDTGLGLSGVYGTMQQYQGVVQVRSIVGHGTSFRLLFPSAETDGEEVLPNVLEHATGLGNIQAVDDEDIMRSLCEQILKGLGYSDMLANNGQECIDVYEQYKDDIDLVILDMIMPEMNGRDCFIALR